MEHDKFVALNTWLSGINNERPSGATSALARARIVSLERFVLIRFADDGVVVPGGSEWFGRLVRPHPHALAASSTPPSYCRRASTV